LESAPEYLNTTKKVRLAGAQKKLNVHAGTAACIELMFGSQAFQLIIHYKAEEYLLMIAFRQ
jgi:hypothetical protein